MADFAAARGVHPAHFADRIGREVVVQQEGLLVGAFQGVDELLVVAGAQRGDHQRLGLAPGEQGRAVGARQDADFGDDRADHVEGAAVDPLAGRQHVAAQNGRLAFLERRAELGGLAAVGIGVRLHQGRHGLGLGGSEGRVARLFGGQLVGRLQLLADQGGDLSDQRALILRLEIPGILRRVFGQFDDRLDHRLEAAVGEHHPAQDLVFGQLLDFGFDHHHRVFGAGDDEIHPVALAQLVEGRVEHIFAVDEADAGGADRAHERHARKGQGGGGGDHGDDIGIVLQVVGQDRDDHLGLMLEALDEQGADRPVDQAGDQGLLLGRTAFALEEAARDLAGGVGLFLVVDGEREEVEPGLGRLFRHHRGQDHGLAVGGEDGAVRLAGDAAGFQGQLAAAPIDGLAFDVEHVSLSFSPEDPFPRGADRGRNGCSLAGPKSSPK